MVVVVFTLRVASADDGSESLSLTVGSTRAVCTANSLIEISRTITGGTAPYSLTIDGASIAAGATSASVQCDPLPPSVKPGGTPTHIAGSLK